MQGGFRRQRNLYISRQLIKVTGIGLQQLLEIIYKRTNDGKN